MENINTILIFVVGVSDVESNSITSIHSTYGGALKSWNIERMKLLKQYKQMKFYAVSQGHSHDYDNNMNIYINNLLCEDPKKIDNYPQETPYISMFELLD